MFASKLEPTQFKEPLPPTPLVYTLMSTFKAERCEKKWRRKGGGQFEASWQTSIERAGLQVHHLLSWPPSHPTTITATTTTCACISTYTGTSLTHALHVHLVASFSATHDQSCQHVCRCPIHIFLCTIPLLSCSGSSRYLSYQLSASQMQI